ncbi:M48 family metallopeptidase [Thauera sinica]|uniref:M48 family metallopeptidase n=1 Tax=Thauera sinica TaxID=2665146 RepID=A0ABW1AZ25_9RHOO|nr:SprT family zinc-dependent metalloprotease [Thauera sp. K11]ATE59054.1 hydrolase [Thauera sp. K11]
MGRQGLSTHAGAPAASEVPHAVDIGGTRVALTLRRSARRSFALQVDHRGARVAVPFRATLADVDRFVRDHGQWLLDRLRMRAAAAPPVFRVEEGAILPLLGRPLRLRFESGRRARWCSGQDGVDELLLPAAADPRRALLRTLQARALDWHRNRVEEYCLRLGLPVPAVRLSGARTRWGSCSSASGIRLHWRLIHLPPALIDYVVAHEVAHLVEMNHSPRFWAVVERIYPDWRRARLALRAASSRLPVIGDAEAADMGA